MSRCARTPLALILGVMLLAPFAAVAQTPTKKILLVGQRRDHPPGAHQYMAGLRVLAKSLEGVPHLKLEIVSADEPWSDGPRRLEHVDGVVLYLGEGGRWIQSDRQRLETIERLARSSVGIVAIHWAIGAKDGKFITPYREIIGGIHGGADRKYVISENELTVLRPDHPIMRGIRALKVNDEWYYQLKFSSLGEVQPLIAATIDVKDETVGWAYIRESGGRSFGFSGMHYFENWKNESLRRMIANAVLWSVDLDIPENGMPVRVPDALYQLGPDE